MDAEQCCKILNVSYDASAQEITQAYRDLVKVWNPERFSHDLALQEKAQNTLKTIDEAFDILMANFSKTEKFSTPAVSTITENIEYIENENDNNTPQPVPIPPSAIAFAICLVLVFGLSMRFPIIGNLIAEGGFVFLSWWLLLSAIAFMVAVAQKAQNKKPYLSTAFWIALVLGILYGLMNAYSPKPYVPQPVHNVSVPSTVQLTTIEEERLRQIVQGVLTKPDFLNEQIHREFWGIIEKNGTATTAEKIEIQQQVREKMTYPLTTYMKHYYSDALETLRISKPYKSPERKDDESKMLADGRITSERIQQNEILLQKIAKRELIERNGQTFVFDKAMINIAVAQLDAAANRVEKLFTKP